MERLVALVQAEPNLIGVLTEDSLARLAVEGTREDADADVYQNIARLILRRKVWSARRKVEALAKYSVEETEALLASFVLPQEICFQCGLQESKGHDQTWLDAMNAVQRKGAGESPEKLWERIERHPIVAYVPVQCQSCGHQIPDVYPAPDDPHLSEDAPTDEEKPFVRSGWFRGPKGPVVFVYNCPSCNATSRWFRATLPEVMLNPRRWGRLCGEQEDLKAWLAKYFGVRLRVCYPLDWDHVWAELFDGTSWRPLDPNCINFARRLHEGIGAWTRVLAIGTSVSGEAQAATEDVTEAYLARAAGTPEEVSTWKMMITAARGDQTGKATQSRTVCGYILEQAGFDDARITEEMKAAQSDFDKGLEWWDLSVACSAAPARAMTCTAGHVLQEKAALPGRICDLCNASIEAGQTVFCCQACDFDVCIRCFHLDPADRDATQKDKMRRKLQGYSSQAKYYADAARQVKARSCILDELLEKWNATEAEDVRGREAFLRELLRWFKSDFFRWTNQPKCPRCGEDAKKNMGMVEPNEEELRYGAGRVESWLCESCDVPVRFPRYNDPGRLLETRHGRCGEWANCFTLITAALGFNVRLALDFTDHVWTEVWMGPKMDRWLHCDPCEGILDAPLTYEAGWGKKLNYVIAFSPTEVIDVTPRYTIDWLSVKRRRTAVREEVLIDIIEELNGSQCNAATFPWRLAEHEELEERRCSIRGNVSATELQGRTSGSVEWRLGRGEMGEVFPIFQEDRPPSMSFAVKADTGGCTVEPRSIARLLMGCVRTAKDGVDCVDMTGDGACIEVCNADGTCLADVCGSQGGCTVEAWVYVDVAKLSFDAFRNPILSRHGPASGWELRLRQDGGIVFLVTIDGTHHEVEGVADVEIPAWSGGWTHIAATFCGAIARVFASGQLIGRADIPSGSLTLFDGPLLLGCNPAWRDRGARCWLCAARLTSAELSPTDFLPSPVTAGAPSRTTSRVAEPSSFRDFI